MNATYKCLASGRPVAVSMVVALLSLGSSDASAAGAAADQAVVAPAGSAPARLLPRPGAPERAPVRDLKQTDKRMRDAADRSTDSKAARERKKKKPTPVPKPVPRPARPMIDQRCLEANCSQGPVIPPLPKASDPEAQPATPEVRPIRRVPGNGGQPR